MYHNLSCEMVGLNEIKHHNYGKIHTDQAYMQVLGEILVPNWLLALDPIGLDCDLLWCEPEGPPWGGPFSTPFKVCHDPFSQIKLVLPELVHKCGSTMSSQLCTEGYSGRESCLWSPPFLTVWDIKSFLLFLGIPESSAYLWRGHHYLKLIQNRWL